MESEANGIFMNYVHCHDCNDYDPVYILTHQAHVDRRFYFSSDLVIPYSLQLNLPYTFTKDSSADKKFT